LQIFIRRNPDEKYLNKKNDLVQQARLFHSIEIVSDDFTADREALLNQGKSYESFLVGDFVELP